MKKLNILRENLDIFQQKVRKCIVIQHGLVMNKNHIKIFVIGVLHSINKYFITGKNRNLLKKLNLLK